MTPIYEKEYKLFKNTIHLRNSDGVKNICGEYSYADYFVSIPYNIPSWLVCTNCQKKATSKKISDQIVPRNITYNRIYCKFCANDRRDLGKLSAWKVIDKLKDKTETDGSIVASCYDCGHNLLWKQTRRS